MKLLIKLALAAVVLLVVTVIGIVAAVVMFTDRAAAEGIRRGGTYAMGVTTTVDSVSFRPIRGTFGLTGLEIGNPEGFDTPYFLNLRDGGAAISLSTLWSNRIELPELTLSGLRMNIDKSDGKANYETILENLKRFESAETPPEGEEADPDDGEALDVLIHRIEIRDVEADIQMQEGGGEVTRIRVPIDEITLENVSLHGDRTEVYAQLSSILTQAIFQGVLANASDLPNELVRELGSGLEGLRGLDDLSLQVVGSTVETLQQGANDALEEVGAGVEEAIGELGKGLGDLLGGDGSGGG